MSRDPKPVSQPVSQLPKRRRTLFSTFRGSFSISGKRSVTSRIDDLISDGDFDKAQKLLNRKLRKSSKTDTKKSQTEDLQSEKIPQNLLTYLLKKCVEEAGEYRKLIFRNEEYKSLVAENKSEDVEMVAGMVGEIEEENQLRLTNILQAIIYLLQKTDHDKFLKDQIKNHKEELLKQLRDIKFVADSYGSETRECAKKIGSIIQCKSFMERDDANEVMIILRGGVDVLAEMIEDRNSKHEDIIYIIDLLIKMNLINTPNAGGKMPVDIVMLAEDMNLLKYILGKPQVNIRNSILFTIIVLPNPEFRYQALDMMLNRFNLDPSVPNKNATTLLQIAADQSDKRSILRLIWAGVDVNHVQPKSLYTALHMAIPKGRVDVVSVLLLHGANINAQESSGKTPLHCAFATEPYAVAYKLINSGADLEINDQKGRTPLGLASNTVEGYEALAKFLANQKSIDKNYLKIFHHWIDAANIRSTALQEDFNTVTRKYIFRIIQNLQEEVLSQKKDAEEIGGLLENTQELIKKIFPKDILKHSSNFDEIIRDYVNNPDVEHHEKLAKIGAYMEKMLAAISVIHASISSDLPEIEGEQSEKELKKRNEKFERDHALLKSHVSFFQILVRKASKVNSDLQHTPNPLTYVEIDVILSKITSDPTKYELSPGEEYRIYQNLLKAYCREREYIFVPSEDTYLQVAKLVRTNKIIEQVQSVAGQDLDMSDLTSIDGLAAKIPDTSFETELHHACNTKNIKAILKIAALDDKSGFLRKKKANNKLKIEDILHSLLERAGGCINEGIVVRQQKESQDQFKKASLYEKAIITLITTVKMNLNFMDSQGITLIHKAAEYGMEKLVRLLIDYNVNINPFAGMKGDNKFGGGESFKTPLHLAIEGGHNNIVRELVDNNADVQGHETTISPIRSTLFSARSEAGSKKENYIAATILLSAEQQKINKDYVDVLEKWLGVYFTKRYSNPDLQIIMDKIGRQKTEILDEVTAKKFSALKSRLAGMNREVVESKSPDSKKSSGKVFYTDVESEVNDKYGWISESLAEISAAAQEKRNINSMVKAVEKNILKQMHGKRRKIGTPIKGELTIMEEEINAAREDQKEPNKVERVKNKMKLVRAQLTSVVELFESLNSDVKEKRSLSPFKSSAKKKTRLEKIKDIIDELDTRALSDEDYVSRDDDPQLTSFSSPPISPPPVSPLPNRSEERSEPLVEAPVSPDPLENQSSIIRIERPLIEEQRDLPLAAVRLRSNSAPTLREVDKRENQGENFISSTPLFGGNNDRG